MRNRERLIRIEYYDSAIKLIDTIILPFKGFQWIDTEIEVTANKLCAKITPKSIKITIFESYEEEKEK